VNVEHKANGVSVRYSTFRGGLGEREGVQVTWGVDGTYRFQARSAAASHQDSYEQQSHHGEGIQHGNGM
jgi:hypothetical protein